MTDITERLRERVARKLAARKMGLRNDVNGERLPDELWSQCIFDADAAIEATGIERLVMALRRLNEHIEAMQRRVTEFLIPDSQIGEDELANLLIEMLDGPEQREAQGKARQALLSVEGEGM